MTTVTPPASALRRALACALATVVAATAAVAVAAVPWAPPAAAGEATVANGCSYSVDDVVRELPISLVGAFTDEVVEAGAAVTLGGVTAGADLPSWLPITGYNLGLLVEGPNSIPVRGWVALQGTNTAEGVQVVSFDAVATTTITVDHSLPDTDPGHATATPLTVTGAVLPPTTWTATGGTVSVRQAPAGTLPATLPAGPRDAEVTPTGSAYISARPTDVLRFNLDCQPGTVDVVNPPYPFTPATAWPAFASVLVSTPYECAGTAPVAASFRAGAIAAAQGPASVAPGEPVAVADIEVDVAVGEPGALPAEAVATLGAQVVLGPGGEAVDLPSASVEATHDDGSVARLRLGGGAATVPAPAQAGTLQVTVDRLDLALAAGSASCGPAGAPAGLLTVAVADPPPPPPPPPPGPGPDTPGVDPAPPADPGLPEDRTPVTTTATYAMTCSYVYDLPGSEPAQVRYQTEVTATVPTRVRAGSQVTLSGQRWVTTIPWEARGPLVTAFLNGAVTEGEVVQGRADTTVSATATVEGAITAQGTPAQLGPLHEGQATTLAFSPPDGSVTAVGGAPVELSVAAARFTVQLRVSTLPTAPTVTITFDCQPTNPGTVLARTEVTGTSALVAAPTAGRGSLPRTGTATAPLLAVGTALLVGGLALARAAGRARRTGRAASS